PQYGARLRGRTLGERPPPARDAPQHREVLLRPPSHVLHLPRGGGSRRRIPDAAAEAAHRPSGSGPTLHSRAAAVSARRGEAVAPPEAGRGADPVPAGHRRAGLGSLRPDRAGSGADGAALPGAREGRALGHLPTDPATVLYIALEDRKRRVKKR